MQQLETNPYCRRAVAQGVDLARTSGGECVVLTLGPPAAEDCLREAVACGAAHGDRRIPPNAVCGDGIRHLNATELGTGPWGDASGEAPCGRSRRVARSPGGRRTWSWSGGEKQWVSSVNSTTTSKP